MIWLQQWTDVLFLHFPLAERELRLLVPANLAIETYRGLAWLSYVFFRLQLRPAWLPNIPGFSSLYELNVRTYVRHRDQAGIYFLRMYADNRLAILASRLLTPLKYEAALMTCDQHSNGSRSIICQPRNTRGSIRLDFRLGASPSAATAAPNSLDDWLLERYRAFVPRRDQSLLRATVEHPPWQAAQMQLLRYEDDLADAIGIPIGDLPALCHYARVLAARFNPFEIAASPQTAGHAVHENRDRNKEKRSKEKVAGTGFEPATSRL